MQPDSRVFSKVKSEQVRKTHSDKFPLTLHKAGQYCKKIKGELHYFGTDKNAALNRYLEQAAYLHAGKRLGVRTAGSNLFRYHRV